MVSKIAHFHQNCSWLRFKLATSAAPHAKHRCKKVQTASTFHHEQAKGTAAVTCPQQRWPHQQSGSDVASSSTCEHIPWRCGGDHQQQAATFRKQRGLGALLLSATSKPQRLYTSLSLLCRLALMGRCLPAESGCRLLAVALVVPGGTAGQWRELASNHVFLVGFWAWLTAQTLKIFTKRYKKGIWDIKALLDSGGMPSSHSALCTSVTTAIAIEYGLGSPMFAMALCFSLIVMYDATGVRRHAGKQAEVLNIMLGEILEGHPIRATKLKEVLGHTPLQVIGGALLGVVVGCLFPQPSPMIPL